MNGADRGGYYHELFLNGRPDLGKLILRTRVKGSCMKAPSHVQEPDLYSLQRCSSVRATKADLVESSSDDIIMPEKQPSDDASTHSSGSASTLGPQPIAAPSEIQTRVPQDDLMEPVSEDEADVVPFTASMSFHEVPVPEPLSKSYWDESMEHLMPIAEIPSTVMEAVPSSSHVHADEHNRQELIRRVSCDEQAFFEGRSFQVIDETTLRSMEAVLISRVV
jgi:hypothetical protein